MTVEEMAKTVMGQRAPPLQTTSAVARAGVKLDRRTAAIWYPTKIPE